MTSAADRRWTILVAMCLATAVTEFDETVMAVALPSIDASFHTSLDALQWSVAALLGSARLDRALSQESVAPGALRRAGLTDAFLHALTTTMAIGPALVAVGAVLALGLIGRAPVRPPTSQVLQDA